MAGSLRVIVASPNGTENEQLADWLTSEGFETVKAVTRSGALAAITARPFDLLVADAGLAFKEGLEAASRPHRRNPQAPVIVIGDSAARPQAEVRGAMFVERPVDREAVLCAIAMASVDERPIRRSERKPVDRIEALVDGIRSHIVDVSPEGLRIEIPSDRRSAPPPYFTIRVPIIGAAVTVQRMWFVRRTHSTSLYGGALARNSPKVDLLWRKFVDAVPHSGSGKLEID